MTQKILVPLDGTEIGESVLPKLENLVFKTIPGNDIEVTLLRVISNVNFNVLTENPAAQLPYSQSELEEMTNREQQYLDRIALRMRSGGVTVKTSIRIGRAAEEIVKSGSEIGANLIAMSTHGHHGFVRWAIGSVTERVLRLEGKIPILAIRASDGNEKNQVLTIDSMQSLVHPS